MIRKMWSIVAVVLILTLTLSGCAMAQKVEKWVNGEPLTTAEVDKWVGFYQLWNKQAVDRAQVADAVVSGKVVMQEAVKKGVSADPALVKANLDNITKQLEAADKYGSRAKLEKAMKDLHLTWSDINRPVEELCVGQALVVKESEVQEYTKVIFSEAKVHHIMLTTGQYNPKGRTPADALKLAKEIRDKITSGKMTFEAAAKKYSDDPTSKTTGGLLFSKPIAAISLVQNFGMPFAKITAALSAKTISEPVQSQYGYHLIQVSDVKHKTPPKDSAEYNAARAAAYQTLAADRQQAFQEKLMAHANIVDGE